MAERRVAVARLGDLLAGERMLVEVEGKEIGLFCLGDRYHAALNVCPHELAPVCFGRLTGTTEADRPGEYRWVRDGEILVCPWHGWEFDLCTGRALADKRRLRTYPVTVEDGIIYLTVGA